MKKNLATLERKTKIHCLNESHRSSKDSFNKNFNLKFMNNKCFNVTYILSV